MALAYATLVAPEVQPAVSAEDAIKLKTAYMPLDAAASSNKDKSIPPGDGWYPVDALYNFGSIRDLFAMRRTF
jgi:hypothetical protein